MRQGLILMVFEVHLEVETKFGGNAGRCAASGGLLPYRLSEPVAWLCMALLAEPDHQCSIRANAERLALLTQISGAILGALFPYLASVRQSRRLPTVHMICLQLPARSLLARACCS